MHAQSSNCTTCTFSFALFLRSLKSTAAPLPMIKDFGSLLVVKTISF